MKTIKTTNSRSHLPAKRRTAWLFVAAASVVLVVGLIVFNLGDGGDDNGATAKAPLELSLGAGDGLASCAPFDVQVLADLSPAFAATATAVEPGLVTLDVDRWYAGGDAEQVQLLAEAGQAGLIAGFDFEVGGQYLITAAQGAVNFCGYSGPATPELTTIFDQAFAG